MVLFSSFICKRNVRCPSDRRPRFNAVPTKCNNTSVAPSVCQDIDCSMFSFFFYHDNRKTGALVKQMRLTVHETPIYFVQFSYICLLSRTLAALLVIFQVNAHNFTF